MTRAGVTDKTHDHENYSNLVCLGSAIYQVSQQVLDRITYELRERGTTVGTVLHFKSFC